MVIGKRARRLAMRIDRLQPEAIAGEIGGSPGEESGDLGLRARGKPFIRIEVENPVVARLALGEALLGPVARPGIVHDPRAERPCDRHRLVAAAGIDQDHLVHQVTHGSDAAPDPVGLVLCDDRAGDGKPSDASILDLPLRCACRQCPAPKQ